MSDPTTRGEIVLEGVTKRFGSVVAVHELDLTIPGGEFFSMLGPSGCGKTTTLRMIGGFEEPTSGRILLQGEDVTWVPPAKRNVNMVFQAYGLFPHMTVADNVAFGLKIKRVEAVGGRRRGSPRRCGWCAWRGWTSGARGSSPAASSSASRWPARWSTARRRCSWTSRSAPSTSSCARRCSSS